MKWLLIIVGIILFRIINISIKNKKYIYKVVNNGTGNIDYRGSYTECCDYAKRTKRIEHAFTGYTPSFRIEKETKLY